ncbi:serine hydrolase [Phyllobacterium zundukense]|uniref:Beta-lactamase-related domain-containing protein n=1 Tax=Phyllobacterium zundukense TaxID=1867719 RepID=A0A2N9VUP8_9HYPH|nr:serine hydrolase [Phyllobacterium zundukense]ATU95328.1 hypothetical protein BLM14_26865 [Phyllobacterium zundukense]PIO43216.1 hypothetical protein B5P45_19215 [Phyllobacterium zundukense]
MTISRRNLVKGRIAAGTASIVLAASKTAASGASEVTVRSHGALGHRYENIFEKLVGYTKEEIAEFGLPGKTFCLVDAVHPSHLFQIGSISKSFTGLCVHRLADEGKVALTAIMRKLAIIANALLGEGRKWSENRTHPAT